MTKWIKPNGKEIDINDNKATTTYVESLGWKRAEANEKEPNEDGLDPLRAEYLEAVGKKPHHASGEEKMKADIAAAKKGS